MNTRFYITHKVNKSREVGFAFVCCCCFVVVVLVVLMLFFGG